jgi:hypothetical protein
MWPLTTYNITSALQRGFKRWSLTWTSIVVEDHVTIALGIIWSSRVIYCTTHPDNSIWISRSKNSLLVSIVSQDDRFGICRLTYLVHISNCPPLINIEVHRDVLPLEEPDTVRSIGSRPLISQSSI